jgi:hypothetical protein
MRALRLCEAVASPINWGSGKVVPRPAGRSRAEDFSNAKERKPISTLPVLLYMLCEKRSLVYEEVMTRAWSGDGGN